MRKICSSTNAVDRSAYRSRALVLVPAERLLDDRPDERVAVRHADSPALPRLTAIGPNSRGGVAK